ncbi:MAG: hypothetical protein K8R74_07480 [Bacteroidales bacterium]|nr:hypothetical protein [Bacteroidales bacterium]
MTTYKFAILRNENPEEHLEWVKACELHPDIGFNVIDLTRDNWLEEIQQGNYDCLLAKPSGLVSYYKTLYDERIYILNKVLNYKIYPSFDELFIYENKRLLSYYLKAKKIPHPQTWVFYNKPEAEQFIEQVDLPIVGKTLLVAGGSGVRILKNRTTAINYIHEAFSQKGITRNWSPNIRKGSYTKRLVNRLKDIPGTIRYFINKRKAATIDPQRWFVLFQEYIPVDFEWRCVKIGESCFAHKKLRSIGEMISGSSNVSWDGPPEKLLEFMKAVTENGNLLSQAIDIFEDKKGNYLVNELQCFWGSKNPHQMILDGKPGRYFHKDGNWIFEEGEFNMNNSYNLRLAHVIQLLDEGIL